MRKLSLRPPDVTISKRKYLSPVGYEKDLCRVDRSAKQSQLWKFPRHSLTSYVREAVIESKDELELEGMPYLFVKAKCIFGLCVIRPSLLGKIANCLARSKEVDLHRKKAGSIILLMPLRFSMPGSSLKVRLKNPCRQATRDPLPWSLTCT
jgi:hypothetical protein